MRVAIIIIIIIIIMMIKLLRQIDIKKQGYTLHAKEVICNDF